ncbi:MAG: Gfo/Idh/MocA family oxidoreductase, partial [Victivallaceae bacterium]
MGIKLGIVGLGSFGGAFVQLFKAHPLVDKIALCDIEESKLKYWAEQESLQDKFNSRDAYNSLDEICKADLDAIVVITQPWLHAPQCIQVMESGKHVYSAVPVISLPDFDETLDWCGKLIETTRRTGMHYMLGETTVYRPQTMYCRHKAKQGAFGNFVYAEGEYVHDVDWNCCSLRYVQASRTTGAVGAQYNAVMEKYWKKRILGSPMSYPTHSVSGPLSVMDSLPKKVSA